VVIAPSFSEDALAVLKGKKNRILLVIHDIEMPQTNLRSCLNGVLVQDRNNVTDSIEDLKNVTNRVDALEQAIHKAGTFKFDLNGAVMASDAFFPFPDCVEIAKNAGVSAVIQPGGSIKDQLSIDYCNNNGVAMVMTGTRHFKH